MPALLPSSLLPAPEDSLSAVVLLLSCYRNLIFQSQCFYFFGSFPNLVLVATRLQWLPRKCAWEVMFVMTYTYKRVLVHIYSQSAGSHGREFQITNHFLSVKIFKVFFTVTQLSLLLVRCRYLSDFPRLCIHCFCLDTGKQFPLISSSVV